jgi:UDP-4-amino-4,6-dideoxy-N-acetyl-beta-L-altrosamine N-acetyltransferase
MQKSPISGAYLRPMVAADLERVLTWRNHPDVRRYMYTQHAISLKEHTHWFERASQDEKRHLLVFENDEISLGFINFHQIAEGSVMDWGFYVAPDAPKGTGSWLGNAALSFAFEKNKWHKICGQALAYNERSIRFHQNLRFTQEGMLRKQHFDGMDYHDIFCFGLLASEWLLNKNGEQDA